jgi:hypothetical protein
VAVLSVKDINVDEETEATLAAEPKQEQVKKGKPHQDAP